MKDRTQRGRDATTPHQIPAKGWWDILKRTFEEFGEDRILLIAAGVTFYLLLALIPALGAFLSLYGLFFDPSTIREHIASLGGILPASTLDLLRTEAQRIAEQGTGALSVTFLVSFLIALWSANAGMKAIIDALNLVYEEEEKRSFIGLTATSLLMTMASMAFLLIVLAALALVPLVLSAVDPPPAVAALLALGRWPLMLTLVVASFAALYRFGPSRISPQWRWISWGSALAALGWLLVSVLFSWYVGNFSNYNATYGSLGAVIALMTWLWLSTTVVLLGAELNSEMEHQTARDTTVGPEKPMGARGATMADTIGRASEATRPARNPASSPLTGRADPSHLLATHGRIVARNVHDVTARFTSAVRATARARPGRTLTVAALAGLVVGIIWKA